MELDKLPLELLERILKYCNLDTVIACYDCCPRIRSILPRTLALSEFSGAYFERLIQVVDPNCISLSGFGPTVPDGALGLLISALEVNYHRLDNLVSLDLSRQVQPINQLVSFLASARRLKSLRFLSIRPSESFTQQGTAECPNPIIHEPLPSLNETHIHLYGHVLLKTEWMRNLLQLLQRVQVVSICEAFCTKRKWLPVFEESAVALLFPHLRILRLSDESGLQDALVDLGSDGRNLHFPNLQTIIIDLPQRFRSFRTLSSRISAFTDYETVVTERTVGARMFQKASVKHPQLIHQPIALPHLAVKRLDQEEKNLSVFFNADMLTDNAQLLEMTQLEYKLGECPQGIECLGIGSRMADTVGDPKIYRKHCTRLAEIFRSKLFDLFLMCGERLRFVVVNLQLLAACTIDENLRAMFQDNRGRFTSVETLHILGTIAAASYTSVVSTWSSIRHVCGLFPNLKTLRISYLYGLDPEDLKEAIGSLPNLSTLHVNRLPLNDISCQKALRAIFQIAEKLETVSLILPQLASDSGMRLWTRAFKSRCLKYLYIELSAGGVVSMAEASALISQQPALEWLIIKCNDTHVIEMRRQCSDQLSKREHLRLETLDLPVMFPQLFGLFWFTKWQVSYFLQPNYSANHMEAFLR